MSRHLPITLAEAQDRGWHELDIIFISGDAYIDHPAFGIPLLARWLEAYGFKVGIIPQPDWRTVDSFTVLGRPRLFFAVSAGAMDSLVAHYTPRKKLRHDDAYTPGGKHGARPNRASIIYTSRLKQAFRDVPVVLGGIEASLRRLAHYDFWDDAVRRSILLDAKADLVLYGMGEHSLLQLAQRMRKGERIEQIHDLRGSVYSTKETNLDGVRVPSFEAVRDDKAAYLEAFKLAEQQQNPYCAHVLLQPHGDRLIVCNPPALPLTTAELDAVYALPFSREPHPAYRTTIPAFEQIRTSLTSHRGCYGGCSFCAITAHQGKFIQSRTLSSLQAELRQLQGKAWFRGSISDVGGPTANMYRTGCGAADQGKRCRRPSCLHPEPCPRLQVDDAAAVAALQSLERKVKHLTVASGIRYDLLEQQPAYFQVLVKSYVGGLLKIAPEHLVDEVLRLMRKPGKQHFAQFLERFREESKRLGKRQSVVPYLMSGHPGCHPEHMVELVVELRRLGVQVEQVQEFTPTPGTVATCMYYTGMDPATGTAVYVAKSDRAKLLQKSILLWHLPEERQRATRLLREEGYTHLLQLLEGGSVHAVRHRTERRGIKKRTAR